MTQAQSTAAAPLMPEQTVWSEHVSWIDRVPRWVSMVALMVGFLAVWQLVYLIELVSPIILPSPLETIEDLFVVGRNLLTGDYMLKALWVTTQEVLLGFIIAVVFGFALGVLVGETSFGERAVMPYLVAINTMPKVAFAPLFVSWLGFGIASKVALAAFIAFFPVIVGTAAGLHAADQNARMLFKTMGASRWQTLVQLKLPIGMPHFFAGLKNAAVLTVVGAVVGEFLGGGKGFGELIRVAAAQLDTPRVFSLIIYLSLLGLATFWVVAWAQRRFVFWHKETVTEETLGQ
ncbi:ABC transporter permease [Microvirga pakistanensis]|jgi:NitT/TauT family transport system permease protein|uniref:ABC transporter permease n=1 Tax=Microvirga pakistanensis TaxID=1682650 RepID=UPI00106A5CF2|nr:ABC transporter permease [Microvirga pakistanensis]